MRPLVPSFTSPLVLPTVALGLLAGACTLSDRMSRSESTSVRAPTRDSAGVQIVEYGGSLMDLPSAFRIVESPLLDLGGPRGDPDHELTPSHRSITLRGFRMGAGSSLTEAASRSSMRKDASSPRSGGVEMDRGNSANLAGSASRPATASSRSTRTARA